MIFKNKEIFIVCSDPGASQAILLLYKKLKFTKVNIVVIARNSGQRFAHNAGIRVYKDKDAYSNYKSIEKFLRQQTAPNMIVTGTSLRDNLERNYIRASRALNIPVISLIDWWTNVEERFIHTQNRQLCLPDLVCVPDLLAKKICQKKFGSKTRIAITGNPYLSNIASNYKHSHKQRKNILKNLGLDTSLKTILFLAEPTEPFAGFDQFEIFRRIALELTKTVDKYKKSFNLIIKFHPNGEKKTIYRKYEDIVNKIIEKKCKIALVKKKNNIHDLISVSDYIWGMNTTPLLEAMIRKKLVSSFLPGINLFGIPFLKESNFCPSVNTYSQFPGLIKNLLSNKRFVKSAIEKQKKFKFQKKDSITEILTIIKSELKNRNHKCPN